MLANLFFLLYRACVLVAAIGLCQPEHSSWQYWVKWGPQFTDHDISFHLSNGYKRSTLPRLTVSSFLGQIASPYVPSNSSSRGPTPSPLYADPNLVNWGPGCKIII